MPLAATSEKRASWRDALTVYLQKRVLIVMFLGFSSGLPLALSGSTLQVWLTESGVDLGTIGLLGLVGVPYTIKFFWAPVVDAFDVPWLTKLLGRRRGWLIFSQLLLIAAILLLATTNPTVSPVLVGFCALLVAVASATQDIVVDTFRVESLPEDEQAAGAASYVAAYRVGMLISTAGALFFVSGFEQLGIGKSAAWFWGYVAMAAFVGIGMLATIVATEPNAAVKAEASGHDPLRRLLASTLAAFADFLTRRDAIAALVFVVLFKFCDAFAGAMTAPFVIDIGFSRTDYAAIVKGVGLAAVLVGGFAGGFIAKKLPMSSALWIGGILQAVSNLAFSWLATLGTSYWALTAAIVAENFTGAIGTVIFVAYLSALCQSPLYTATQYALLTALSAVGRVFMPAAAGFLAEAVGWPIFFALSLVTAIPSFLVLIWLQRRGHFAALSAAKA